MKVADFLTLFIGGIGIGVALINQRRQLNAQMFIEFSKRFEELLQLFPTEAWLANRRRDQELPPSRTTLEARIKRSGIDKYRSRGAFSAI
jgi:hypothetical protein